MLPSRAARVGRTHGLVVRFRQRIAHAVYATNSHRHRLGINLRPQRRSGLRKLALSELSTALGLVSPLAPLLVRLGNGGDGAGPHDADLPARRLQISTRTNLARRRRLVALYARYGVHRTSAPLGPRCLLGRRRRSIHGRPCTRRWADNCRSTARRPNHRRRHAQPFLRAPRVCNPRNPDCRSYQFTCGSCSNKASACRRNPACWSILQLTTPTIKKNSAAASLFLAKPWSKTFSSRPW